MEDIISYFQEIGRLKKVKRKGWIIDGVKESESVSEHSWRTAIIVMVLGKKRGMDLEQAIKMALIHDIPEVRTGDIVEIGKINYALPGKGPSKEKYDKVSQEEKNNLEEEAARKIFSEEHFKLWKEYQEGKTEEAKFVKEVEKIETVLQALEYEIEGNYNSKTLHHYYVYGRDMVKDPELVKILDEIESRRPKK